MSAFICGPDHIKALAIFAAHRVPGRGPNVDPRYFKYDGGDERMYGRPDDELATYYANILYAENIRSVQARYPGDTFEDLPGLIQKPDMLEVTANESFEQYAYAPYVLKPVDILKMANCLEYQSCETNDWRDTLAYRLLLRIKEAAIRLLPGYDDAPWEYERPEGPKQPAPVRLSDLSEFVRRKGAA